MTGNKNTIWVGSGTQELPLNPENIVDERFSIRKVASCYHHQISSLPPRHQLQFSLALPLDPPKE